MEKILCHVEGVGQCYILQFLQDQNTNKPIAVIQDGRELGVVDIDKITVL